MIVLSTLSVLSRCYSIFIIFTGGWVHSVSFSPSGNKLTWVGHDSSISVVSGEKREVETMKGQFLPFLSCIWVTENTIVAGGIQSHDLLFVFISFIHFQIFKEGSPSTMLIFKGPSTTKLAMINI